MPRNPSLFNSSPHPRFCGVLPISYIAGSNHTLAPLHAYAADDCQTFTQTGHQVCGPFLAYWAANGGLAQQGYPISDPFMEMSATDGKAYQVQYFERAEFEMHPELPAGSNVLLTLLGSEKYKVKYAGKQPSNTSVATSGVTASPTVTKAPPTAIATTPASPVPTATSSGPMRQSNAVRAVTINGIRDPAKDSSGINSPKAGNRYVAFDVTIENLTQMSQDYNKFECSIKTTDASRYTVAFGVRTGDPDLGGSTNAPGDKTRGWVTFEIPVGATVASFTYGDSSNDTVTIRLV